MAFIDRNQQHREPAPDLTEHLPKSRKLVRVDKGVKRGLFKKKKCCPLSWPLIVCLVFRSNTEKL